MDVTLLEIHLPGAAFNAPFAHGDRDDADGGAVNPDAAPGGRSVKALVIALVVLVALALLARYLRTRDAGDADDHTAV